ncbi:MAG TPA: SLBB domain-containing protein [Nitrospirota bacterium]|nr:SLBB domain-containing protein [Nitrospirota bacterium]
MKKILFVLFCVILLFPMKSALAQEAQQETSGNAVQEMQQIDPRVVQAITNAIQSGDLEGAKKIYQSSQKGQQEQVGAASVPVAVEPPKASLFELTLPGNLKQFGYDLFNKTVSTFAPPTFMPVGPDYIIGPGDQFTLTLWGTTEGIYNLKVTKEGEITLPKVGVISIAGVRFGELEKTLKRHLSKYYNDFNLSVAMGSLKTITVYVVGEVTKPGSYPVSSLTTVYGALFVAGGPTKLGTLRTIQVLRAGKVVKTIDLYDFLLKGDRSQDIKLQNEDTVFVPLIGPVAGVAGAVYRPAIYEMKGQETLDDVIKTAGGILPTALGGRLQLTRYENNQRKVFLDINLENSKINPSVSPDSFREKVQNMDTIDIIPVYDRVWETVTLSGTVQHPGEFQWRPDLRLKEIIDQGGILPISDLTRVEIIRLTNTYSDRQIIPIDLASLMKGDMAQNLLLQPKDEIRVYTRYRAAEKVTVSGEVLRPGTYEIMRGDRLSDLLRRVGGVTAEAYMYGVVFRRKSVMSSESKNAQSFITKMQQQMLITAVGSSAKAVSAEESNISKSELALNQSLLSNLKTMLEQNQGRVAINITANIDEWAGSKEDLLLQDGDSLDIPKKPQEIMILGEVYTPGAQIYLPGMTVKDYLERTGGFTKNADSKEVFIVQANGFAYGEESPSVGNIENVKLQAGDAIFVPQKIERYATLRTLGDIIDVLFKTAVIFATIHILF